ncbi:MAG: hypothetical protein JWO31_3636 [Phycisphaerales bacterium]|nr:hypothetical protein [Phycisphaerales bacterium]
MPDDSSPAPMFDRRSVRRIGAAVRAVERTPGDRTPDGAVMLRDGDETCYGKLTTKVNGSSTSAPGWEWNEVYMKEGAAATDPVTWEVKAGRFGKATGSPTPTEEEKNLAVELVKGTAAAGQVVLLRKAARKRKDADIPLWIQQWVIVAPLAASGKVKCVDDRSHADIVSCKTVDPVSGVESGEAFDVQVTHHTSTGDAFYAVTLPNVAGQPVMLQIGHPTNRAQYAVLQVMDGTGSAQAIDYDYLKGAG